MGENLGIIFFRNRVSLGAIFSLNGRKLRLNFSKAGGGYPPPTPLGRAAPEYWGSTADVFNL